MDSLVFRAVAAVLRLVRVKRVEIGRDGDRYLTRWVLFGGSRRLYLHFFHRSDYAGALHDHPWSFLSLLIWPGYYEHTCCAMDGPAMAYTSGAETKTWYHPLSIVRRPAAWRHRVEILEGRGCWTLVLTGRKTRSWGFWCPGGFRPWREHNAIEETGRDGCA